MSGVWDSLTGLLACAVTTLSEAGEPDPCAAIVVPGSQTVADYIGTCENDGDGMLWVRLASAYPTSGVGIIDETANNCSKPLGWDIELGLIREYPIDESGFPEPDVTQQVADQQIREMGLLRKAIQCCEALPEQVVLRNYEPLGPLGDTVGGQWNIVVGF